MNLESVMDELGIDYNTEGKYCRQGWAQVQCPFCGGGSNPHKPYMGISLLSFAANCWNCGKHKLVETLHMLSGESYPKIRQLVGFIEYSPVELEFNKKRKEVEYPKGLGELLLAHRNYLNKRGFNSDELYSKWGVRGIGIAPRLQWRIFIPIYYHGVVVSWTTRIIVDDVEPRYVSAAPYQEVISHKECLFGHDMVRHSIGVHEGSLDAIAVGPGSCATLGTQVTDQQVAKIAEVPLRFLCFDSEDDAQERARELCDRLSVYSGRTINIQLDSAKDAAGCLLTKAGRKELKQIRRLYLE